MDFSVDFYYTYLSLFTLVTFYLNNSFVHSRKNKKGTVPSIQLNVCDPASTLNFSSQLRFAFCNYLEKLHFNRLRFQYPWVAHGSVISTVYCYPSTSTSFATLLGTS